MKIVMNTLTTSTIMILITFSSNKSYVNAIIHTQKVYSNFSSQSIHIQA